MRLGKASAPYIKLHAIKHAYHAHVLLHMFNLFSSRKEGEVINHSAIILVQGVALFHAIRIYHNQYWRIRPVSAFALKLMIYVYIYILSEIGTQCSLSIRVRRRHCVDTQAILPVSVFNRLWKSSFLDNWLIEDNWSLGKVYNFNKMNVTVTAFKFLSHAL